MTPEGKVVAAIRKAVKAAGGEVRKAVWVGHHGCPDLFVMVNGKTFWIEAKAPGKKPEPHQAREHETMRRFGAEVYVIDNAEGIERLWLN